MFFLKKNSMPSKEIALPGRRSPIETAEKHFVSGRRLKGPYPRSDINCGLRSWMFLGSRTKILVSRWSLDFLSWVLCRFNVKPDL